MEWLHFYQAHMVYNFIYPPAFYCIKTAIKFPINLSGQDHAEIESELLLMFL